MESAPTNTEWRMPVRTFSPLDRDSFAYSTVVKRWPTILTQVISTISNQLHDLTISTSSVEVSEKIEEGKEIVRKISSMKHDMSRDKPLTLIEEDGGSNVAVYNDCLQAGIDADKPWTWFGTSWLFAECYLYRRLRNFFAMTRYWDEFDPFFTSKAETYKSSSAAIVHLAKAIENLKHQEDLKKDFDAKDSALEIVFLEMAQANLWGNATDLSLLVDMSYEDIQKLQSVGKAAQEANAKFILRNDLPQVWDHLKGMKAGRVDFVLDNAGFELYTDFIFADFLLTYTDFVDEVVFHPKTIPWFVSDVLPFDFNWAIDVLQDSTFFSKHSATITSDDLLTLAAMAKRWQSYVVSGKFRLSVPLETKLGRKTQIGDYWTGPYSYQHMPEKDEALLTELSKSDLVIFKGDLNYRKLLGDGKWAATTPFEEALGPLAGKFNLLSLRTNKADPIVGLAPGIQERLDVEDPKWRESGKWAVISFCPKKDSQASSVERPEASAPARQISDTGDVFELTFDTLDTQAIIASVSDNGAGATSVFIGTTRDTFEGKIVTRLTYEAYSSLCIKTFASITHSAKALPSEPTRIHASNAVADRPVKVAIHHRLGEVPVGQASIVIAVSSPHRRQAFEACEYILEEVKKKAQVWKREWYADGDGSEALWKENFGTCCNDHK